MSQIQMRLGAKLRAPDAHQGFKASLSHEESARLPESVDQTKAFDVITQQGNLGSCLLNAFSGACHQRMRAQGLGDFQPARLPPYRACLEADGAYPDDDGTFPETVIKVFSEHGFAPESLAPYSDNPEAIRRRPTPEYEAEAAKWRLTGWMPVDRDRDTVKSELAAGNPLVITILLHQSFQDVGSDGVMPLPKRSEAELGGHGMRVAGYDPEFVRVANSWGRGFGRHGYVFIPWKLVLDPYTTRALHSVQTVQRAA